ncbi:hypothetical protein JEQ12_018671 [Ovis aries]|uniref:Receptor ligand binding region domain-containing protein n=1 Tax=Ovis aries TaxID=9940 RepID=A0A836A144_SHEEP|nr:hypothetical protein JEQ12_018671 [Ovis aries]
MDLSRVRVTPCQTPDDFVAATSPGHIMIGGLPFTKKCCPQKNTQKARNPEVCQVSYESTAETLSDKIRFPSFLWTVPSDFYQTKAMAHLNQKSRWNWIGILTTDDGNGLSTLLQFKWQQIMCA